MPETIIPPKDPNLGWTVVSVKTDKPDLREKEKPLVDLKVTNPVTYIKSWWKKVIGNDGIEMKIKVKPLTAIAMAIIVVTVTLGIGKFRVPFNLPFFEYSQKEESLPAIESPVVNAAPIIRETAFSGILKYDLLKDKYFLLTVSDEAITLNVPTNLNLKTYIGRRIFATGQFNEEDRTLEVESASDMEVLPTKTVFIPTESPTPTIAESANN